MRNCDEKGLFRLCWDHAYGGYDRKSRAVSKEIYKIGIYRHFPKRLL